jgi:ribosomal protein S18 acetylase RimI-like enzyme
MQPGDAAAARAVEVRAGERFREVGMAEIADAEPMSVDTIAGYATNGRAWVAVGDHDDVLTGYLVADIVDGNAHIEQISVDPSHQGRGIGRALIDAAQQWAIARGMPAITLTTFADVSWNRPLYEHLGFTVMTEREIGPELDAVRASEASHGLDPASRVCMRRPVVQPVTAANLGQAVAALTAAFWDYPETTHLLPGEPARRSALPRYLASDVRDSLRFGTAYVVELGGRVAAAAAWLPPDGYPVSLRRQARQAIDLAPTLPHTWRTAREARRGQNVNRAHHRGRRPHFYLRAIGVHPDSQGRGLGAALLGPVLRSADAHHTPCFLQTATKNNVGWYERFGFSIAAAYKPTPSWPEVWAMWREPSQ